MSPSLAQKIVPDTAPRRRGPIPIGDRELSHPLGRSMHDLEGVAFSGSQQAVYYRADAEMRQIHDAQADQHVREIARAAETLLQSTDAGTRLLAAQIAVEVRGYFLADDAEDRAAAEGDARVGRMHHGYKRIAGWCEKVCTVIREGAR